MTTFTRVFYMTLWFANKEYRTSPIKNAALSDDRICFVFFVFSKHPLAYLQTFGSTILPSELIR